MGPFPHEAVVSEISPANPAGTTGMEFVEFAHPDPQELRDLFARMGFEKTAVHKTRDIELWQQGDVTYVLNNAAQSMGMRFVAEHGPCAPSMGWRVVDARHTYQRALENGAEPYDVADKVLDVPAIRGIGGSLIYFIDTYGAKGSPYEAEYDWINPGADKPVGVGFYYLDHLTNNVKRGNMDKWVKFYTDIFNFREIRFFDIKGKATGLTSRALTSPCGRIRIPINESADDKSQIAEYLRDYNGEGIQHIAVGTDDIYASTDLIADQGLEFMPAPNEMYYKLSKKRVHDHQEPLDKLMKHGVLIDGEGVVGGGETRILLQIFSKTVIGPIFFEFIQRKGDDGFGEGNFKALFESIEQDQIDRGVLVAE